MLAIAALIELSPIDDLMDFVAMMTEVVAGLLLTREDTSVLIRDVGVLVLALVWALESPPLIVRNDILGKGGARPVFPNRL